MGRHAKRRRAAACAAALLGGGFAPVSATASPWGREDGEAFVAFRTDRLSNTGDFAPPFDGADADRFTRVESQVYGEYGVDGRHTVVGKVVYRSSGSLDSAPPGAEEDRGLAEFEVGLQRQLKRGPRDAAALYVSVGALNGFRPLGGGGALDEGLDAEIRALYGRDLIGAEPGARAGVFIAGEVAYRRRFGAAADQIRADATLGAKLGTRWIGLVQALSTTSLRNEDPGGQDFDVVRVQASVGRRVTAHSSLHLGYSRDVLGRGVDAGDAVFVGIWTQF
ncbi:MAG: hypothetical protein AAGC56_03480 [Pseudomonadota bacterium]